MKPYHDITDPALAKALAHPLRTRILAALEGQTASPSELASKLDAPLGVVSYHVRRLEALGFLKLVKRVPRRGAVEHYYSAIGRPRITNAAWGKLPAIVKHASIKAAVDQVGAYVAAGAAEGGFNAADAHITRSPVTVDDTGWHALARELDNLLARIAKIESASKARLARSNHADEQEATMVLMLFHSPSEVPQEAAPSHHQPRPSTAGRRRRTAMGESA
ncbi:MAG TPA: winged helix-turn-helix domain-containing protein [Solirubrobacteraceae bacterium]|nr:winged helix-turn-helix domain-containing protein [Solirubrobacteraceae bacterium]